MNSFPVSCHNCFSCKRQFYVFLQCKHFMCLSCSLCLADFQKLTLRCCHRNTKMSEQLVAVMFQQINSRKQLKKSQIQNDQHPLTKQYFECKENSKTNFYDKIVKDSYIDKALDIESNEMRQSEVVNMFKIIDNNKAESIKKNDFYHKEVPMKQLTMTVNLESEILNNLTLQQQKNIQCPTFKQIKPSPLIKKIENHDYAIKQNYICWKNYDSTKDRIMAKLNYHQQKMNSLLRQHYL